MSLMYVGVRLSSSQLSGTEVASFIPLAAAVYWLVSVARDSHAVAMDRISAIDRFCRARCMAVSRFGMAMAARMPMIATTISSSMSVKPCCFLDMYFLLVLRRARAIDRPIL